MSRKLLYLNPNKFNLMLERMEKKVNYDESLLLNEKINLNEGFGKTLSELVAATKNQSDELISLLKGLDGDVKALDDFFRSADDITELKVKINNELVDLGLSTQAIKGLDNFLDLTNAVNKSTTGKDLYTNMIDDLLNKGMDMDDAIRTVDRFNTDHNSLLKNKMGGDDIYIIDPKEPMDVRLKEIKKIVTKNVDNLSPTNQKIVIQTYTRNRFKNTKKLSEEIPQINNLEDYYLIYKDDGNMLLAPKEEFNIKLVNSLKKNGYKVEDAAKNPSLPVKKKRKISIMKNKNKQGPIETRPGLPKWFYTWSKIYGVTLAIETIVDILDCLFNHSEDETWKTDKANAVQKAKEEISKGIDVEKNLENLDRWMKDVSFTDCAFPLISSMVGGDGFTLSSDKRGYYAKTGLFKVIPFLNTFVVLSGIFRPAINPNLSRVEESLRAAVLKQARAVVERALEGKTIPEIVNHSCTFDKSTVMSWAASSEFGKFAEGLQAILSLNGNGGTLEDAQPLLEKWGRLFLGINEEVAVTEQEWKEMSEKVDIEVEGLPTDFTKNLKGYDFVAMANKECELYKATLISRKLSQFPDNADKLKIEDLDDILQFFTTEGKMDKLVNCEDDYNIPNSFSTKNCESNKEKIKNLFTFYKNMEKAHPEESKGGDIEANIDYINQFNCSKEVMDTVYWDRHTLCTSQTSTKTPEMPDITIRVDISTNDEADDYLFESLDDPCYDMKLALRQLTKGKGKLIDLIPNNEGIKWEKTKDNKIDWFITDETVKIAGEEFYCKSANINNTDKSKDDCLKDIVTFYQQLNC